MQDKKFWQFVCDQLGKSDRVAIAIIVETKGSSPRKTGTKMVIASNTTLFGSIGGGGMEHLVIQEAVQMLQSNRPAGKIVQFTHSDGPGINKSGMVCAGRQKVLIRVFRRTERAHLQEIAKLAGMGNKFSIEIGANDFDYKLVSAEGSGSPVFTWQDEQNWRYSEIAAPEFVVYLIGGGHVGYAISRTLAPLDFRVILLDNRPDYEKFTENEWVEEKTVVDYAKVGEIILEGEFVFALILTSSHKDDFAVLQQLVTKNLGYVGFLASASKAKGFFNRLRKQGISDEKIAQISAPMGLLQKSYLPEEIAVSIAAELLQVKNQILV